MSWTSALAAFLGLERAVHPRQRGDERVRALRRAHLVGTGVLGAVLVVDASAGGLGLLVLGRGLTPGEALPVLLHQGVRWARVAHVRRLAPGISRAGLAFLPAQPAASEARVYLAAA